VTEARRGEPVFQNRVYIAPGGRHLAVSSGNDGRPRLEILDDAPLHGVRPSADILFESVARIYGASAVGVVLTGMGRDGTGGLRTLREAGAGGIVQDEATSAVYGMPRAALQAAGADIVAALPGMAQAIVASLAGRPARADVTQPHLLRS
jgi:two-component system chemotaxis response regulator CheB